LVVEDNTMNRKMLVKLFNSVGRSVEEARNGQVAVDKVKQRLAEGRPAYDAILMDFTMVSG
jgi:CheY-like chemotaxis protein